MTATSILLIACAFTQASANLPISDPVFVEVTDGRGTLLAGEQTERLSPADGEQWVEGRGHLSLMASAKASLRWHGRASMQLTGPCEVEWAPCDAESGLEWTLQHVTRATIETRQGPLQIGLGSHWSMSMPPGALLLRGLPNGEYEVFQQAGSPASYQWENSDEHTRPEREGVIGKAIRLGTKPPGSRSDHSALLDGRREWTWPWREEAQDVTSWGYRDWPWVPGEPKHVTVYVNKTPAPAFTPAPPENLTVTVDAAPPVTEPSTDPVHVTTEDSETSPAAPTAKPEGDGTWGWEDDQSSAAGPWRGMSEDGYHQIGEYFIQNNTGVLYEYLADGGVRFWIPENVQSGGWVLGPRLDTRLEPGGSIEFSSSGALRGHFGGVRVLAALER